MKKLNPFKPTDIGGCQLWLDGADSSKITLGSGSNVSTWIDKSSLANNFTSTNTTSPTKTTTPGGYPCVYLNGSTCQMTSVSNNSTTGNSSRTVIMISQTGAGGDSRFGTGPHGGASPPNTYGIDLAPIANIIFCPYVYTGSDVTAYGVPNTNMYSLYSYYNSSTSTVGGIVNFTLTASNSTTLNTSATPWYLGLRPDGGYSINAYVCEIIHYNTILASRDQQQIEGYLAQKWGLEANLPAGSPGRTQVIYPHTLRLNSLTTGQPTLKPYIRSIGAIAPVILGGSFQFTTTPSQYLSIPNSTGFTQNTAFTYELWYYPTSTNGGYIVAMLQHNWITIKWAAGGAGTIGLDMSYVGNAPGYVPQNRTYAINRWHHIALSWNGTNGVLYMNGVSEAVFTGAGGLVNDGNDLRIGQYQGQGQPTPLGYFTNIRFVKGVSVYTGAFTPPTAPLTVTQSAGTNISAITAGQTQLLISAKTSGTLLTDSSTNNFTITNNGSVAWNALTPFS